jgi:hypothetical protein
LEATASMVRGTFPPFVNVMQFLVVDCKLK